MFTEEELAGLLGSINRQAVDGHMKGFRDAEGDLLDFLKRTCNVDDDVVELVWQVFCTDPYASLSSMAAQANASYGSEKPLNEANIREALSQIGGYKIWRKMLKGLEKGQAHYEDDSVVARLCALLSAQTEQVEPVAVFAEGSVVSDLQGTEAQGETLADRVKLSKSFRANVMPLFTKAGDVVSMHEQLLAAWEGPAGVMLLAFVLYTSGLSDATIGGWMAVDASTVCRWLEPFASLGWMWVQQQRASFSGQQTGVIQTRWSITTLPIFRGTSEQ